jgi:hypothetical protein
MVVFGESETSNILANCYPRDLRSHVIILRLAHQAGAVFRGLFVTARKVVSINCDSYVILVVLLSKVLKSALTYDNQFNYGVRIGTGRTIWLRKASAARPIFTETIEPEAAVGATRILVCWIRFAFDTLSLQMSGVAGHK